MSDFDAELNVGYHTNVQDVQTSMIADVVGGVTASVVDAGASIWNSLPGTTEVDTADLLGNISDDALRVYQENPDLIHTASFIGASFIPGGVALKGMNAMRNGSKAVNWFTKLGKEQDLAKVAKLFEEGAGATKDYRAAVRGMYAKTAINQAIDAAAMEVAVIGTLNAAPLVEDYMKDPLTNFGISVAFGGVLGGAVGAIADHYALRQITGGITESALNNTLGRAKPILPDMTSVTQLQVSRVNTEAYDAIVATAAATGKTADNDIAASFAAKLSMIETKRADDIFTKLVSPEIAALPVTQREAIKKLVSDSPEMFGVEKIAIAKAADLEAASIIKAPKVALTDSPELLSTVSSKGPTIPKPQQAVYFQDLGRYGLTSDLKHFSGATVLNKTAEELAAGMSRSFGKVANTDNSLELLARSSAHVQGDYIGAMQRLSEGSAKDLSKILISRTDPVMLTGVIAKMKTDLDIFGTLTVRVGAEGADKATVASLPQLEAMLLQSKVSSIVEMLRGGIPMESIAIKTNTQFDVVQRLALAPMKNAATLKEITDAHVAAGGNAFGNIVNSVDDIAKVLDPSRQPLILSGNTRKSNYSIAAAGLDARTLTNMNAEITAATLYGSKNQAAEQLADFLFAPGSESGSARYVLDMLKSELGKANNQLSGNAFFNSFDFYARNMGSLGPQISYVGKKIQHIANEYIQKINKPVAEAMSEVSKNVADTIEFNTFREVNAGLAGWRSFKDGKIWQKVTKKGIDGKEVTVLEAVKYQGKEYSVVTTSAIKAIETIQGQSPELLSLINTNRRILGQANVSDIGLWVPSFNPVNKFIAYVHNVGDDTTQLLWANTKQEYEQLMRNYKAKLVSNGQDKTIRVIEKGLEQQEWSRLNGRLDTMSMTVADSSAKKSGSSASALVRADNQVFSEIAGGYEHFINSQIRTLADLSMHDITSQLDTLSAMSQGSDKAQPLTAVKRFIEGKKDTARVLKNTLLGEPNLGEYDGWKSVNQSFETGLAFASNTVGKVWDATVRPLTKTFLGGKKELTAEHLAKVDYEKIARELESKGIVNPWANFDAEAASMFGLSRLSDSPDTSKRIIFASNALAATVALRVGELAQPLVNIMSLPILTGLAAMSKMPANFMGVAKGTASVSGTQIIMEGARAANSPMYAHFDALWSKLGYFDPMVSEANKTLQAARSMNKGAIATIEKALDSRFVEVMSKPADWSEAFTRRQTMFTGAVLAKRLYPELGDDGITIFARDFMDKAVGNFHASQRPVFFQGTLGVALGLFQTYSLTLGQSIYRQLELKNYKALGKAALMQSGIFGIGSMPGFQAVSQSIGDHFSDDNVDLTTGTYRALPDKMAETVLYGLPSLAGIGTHTRGDASFRFPGLSGDNVVALNFAKQVTQAVGTMANSLDTNPGKAGAAMLQALSLQNMSRPLARGAELATGYSVTRQGNTVQVPEEVWSTTGVMSRILGTRPLEETQLREAMHLNTFYGSIDRDARNALMSSLRTGIRNGTLTEADVEKASEAYMRKGGTPTGWRSAYRTALAKTETSGREVFADKLKPDNPLNFMIEGLDGY